MTCEKIRGKFADYLVGDLDEKSLAEVQAHLVSCPACREELESLSAIWTKLGVLPQEQPSPALRQRFYSMLEAYKERMEKEETHARLGQTISNWIARFMPKSPVYQFALSVLLIGVGLGAGYWLTGRHPDTTDEVAALRQEVRDIRRLAAVSLLSQASPSERLKGVSWSAQLTQPDEKILQALLDTLNSDPNTNVRLAAVDALYLFYDRPQVKEGLIHSLALQTSPLVQLSLIDLLVEIRERRAAEALEQLIQDEKLDPDVKKRAEVGLARIT